MSDPNSCETVIRLRRKRRKSYENRTVYEAALERIEYLYKRFDKLVVGFSGGKDSTALLNLTVEVAGKLGKLPVEAVFFDEEAITPPTIEYVRRVMLRKDVRLSWYCLPFKHRNACSNEHPYWYCWNPSEREKWVREIPDWAITSHPRFEFGMSYQEFNDVMHPKGYNVCNLTGVRAQESLRRLRAVTSKRNDNYISISQLVPHIFKAHPIYDWGATDVWKYVAESGIDYNTTYDVVNKTGFYNRLLAQRVCQPFGEEPLRSLWLYAECFPEMWHKILNRVDGVGTAWRYANTDLYGVGNNEKPDHLTWREYLNMIYDTYPSEFQPTVRENVERLVARHADKTDDPVPAEDSHPLTGLSWKLLCKIAAKGDFKGRTSQRIENEAIKVQQKLGIGSYANALAIYGKKNIRVVE